MWKFMQIKPQKARGKFLESMWDDPDWVAEEKYDGDRRIAQFCKNVVRFTGCRESVDGTGFVEKTQNVPHLSASSVLVMAQAQARGKIPPATLDGTVLDGEMVLPVNVSGSEGQSKFVTSIMGSLPEEAVRKQIERGWLRYVVFDCLFYRGKDIRKEPLVNRRNAAYASVEKWGNPFVHLATVYSGKRAGWRVCGEGLIFKHRSHIYGNETLWVKLKREGTADVVIIGFKAAKATSKKKGEEEATETKYAKAGLIGAIACGQHKGKAAGAKSLVEVATVSGMDDDLRRDLSDDPKAYIGKVIEIKHNGREPTGRFRHPRFVRFRPDKSAKDCVYDLEEA